jgi:VCBS repeat-containing protein
MARKTRKTIADSKVDLLTDPAAETLANHSRAANAADAANGPAVIGGDLTGNVKEDEIVTASGQLTIDDIAEEREFIPIVNLRGSYGVLSMSKDGAWTYKMDKIDEMPPSWNYDEKFAVTAKDGSWTWLIINVKGTNDAPTFIGEMRGSAMEGGTIPPQLFATDPDANDDLNLAFTFGDPGHGTVQWVDPRAGKFTYTADEDFYGTVLIPVTVTDRQGASHSSFYTVSVGNLWDAPFGSDKSVTISQGDSHVVAVEDLGFSDHKDAGSQINSLDAVFISAVSGAGKLWLGDAELDLSAGPVRVSKADIEAGKLVWKPDAGASGEAHITFNVKDNAGGAEARDDNTSKDANTLTIKVVDVNEAPSFTLAADQVVNEDAGVIVVNGMASGISAGSAGENGQVLTFTLTNDNNALFTEQPTLTANGTLRYKLADNANGVATVSVTLKDDGGTANGGDDTSDTLTFTITANAINDAPHFSAGANQTVDEDSGPHSVGWATDISAGPANESAQTLAFTVTNDNNALFSVQPSIAADGTLTYELTANANGTATVSVTLTDSGSGVGANRNSTGPITFTIDVAPVNDAPVVSVANSLSIVENTVGAVLGQVTTTDVEGQAVSYQIAINTGSVANPVWTPTDLFEIVGDELRLAPGKSLDYEAASSISLRIFATETAGPAPKATAAFTTIRVIDVNENAPPVNRAPTLTTPNADAQVEAGQTISLTIGDTHFTDPDGTDLNYAISVNGAGLPSWMTFDTTSGAFSGKPTTAEAGSYVVAVTASDGALTTSDTFNLIVTSPAAPEATILLSADEVAENSAGGTVVGALSGTDADGDAFVSFSLGSNPDRAFRIVDGELVVRGSAKLDFETRPTYEISIIATDDDGATVEKTFTINLTDVAENPVGTKGNDKLFGDALDNIVNGRRGNDKLTGGDGADTFVFGAKFGTDAILDFDPSEGDIIDLSRVKGIKNFDDLMADHAAQSHAHVRISADDGSVVTIHNFMLADLKADMFIF